MPIDIRMRPTVDYVLKRFEEFNQLCFNGKLPPIPVSVTSAQSYLGKVVYRRERKLLKVRYYDFKMLISRRRDLDADVIDDTILHEMIHYFILYNGIEDSGPHGVVFKKMMHDFNRRFGRKMTVRHRVSEEELSRNQVRRSNLVCVSRLSDGNFGITIAARTRLFELWDGIEAWDLVESYRWVFTDHHFFSRFPRSLKTRLYRVDRADLETALQGARLLRRVGSKIYVSPELFNRDFFDNIDKPL